MNFRRTRQRIRLRSPVRRSSPMSKTGRAAGHTPPAPSTQRQQVHPQALAGAACSGAAALLVLLLDPSPAHAYIGPGAGFALAGSFLAVLAAFFSALLLILTWPVRLLWRALFGWRGANRGRFKRVVILGLDGLDYSLTE